MIKAEEYTFPAALAALVRCFGCGVARELAAATLKPMADAAAALGETLSLHAAMLDDLCGRVKVKPCKKPADSKTPGSPN